MQGNRPWFKFPALEWMYRTRSYTAEQRGYTIQLWTEAWLQDPAGSIPADHNILWRLSGAASLLRWEKNRGPVLETFELREGRYWIPELVALAAEYDRIVSERRKAGSHGAAIRKASKCSANAQQKRSEEKRREEKRTDKEETSLVPKSRHAEFAQVIHDYWNYANTDVPFSFGPADGKALKSLLADNPHLTTEQFKACLWNRHHSEGEVSTRAPRQWLGRILDYAHGPLDRYGKRLENNNAATRKVTESIDATFAAVKAGSFIASGADTCELDAALSLSAGPGDVCNVVEGDGRVLR